MDAKEVAEQLSVARRSRSLLDPPSRRLTSFTIEDGYAVGRLVQQQRLASGWSPVGFKLGFTNQAAWSQLGLTNPFWAPIYDHSVTDRRRVSLAELVAPRIEPEIVLGLRKALSGDAPVAEVSAAVGWAAFGFEIVQCHYPDWELTPPDAIADAGLHANLVVGEQVELGAVELGGLEDLQVELRRNGNVAARGSGSNALGGPIQAVAWLLRLPGIEELAAGAIVTTGTLTSPLPIASGETWSVEATVPGALGRLEADFC
ncbi:MAG: 2-keto-4-pentenoate hydratase [Acidimicrobiales bacterium]